MNGQQTPPRRDDADKRKPVSFRRWQTGELIASRWFVHRVLPPTSMSIIYFCFDTKLGQPMVVKCLPPKHLPDQNAQKRFIVECENWIRLGHHQNIVQAHFVEVVNGYPYVFMEWVNGKDIFHASLSAWIRTPMLTFERAVDIAVQVCDGMIYVTETLSKSDQMFVHRDIKPSNILVTNDWIPKITDFGIAKTRLMTGLSSELMDTDRQNIEDVAGFQEGDTEFLGTPPYMSPEHFAEPKFVDHRSDIYSLGCTIFEMIAGQPVFDADSWDAWREAHIHHKAPSLSDIRSGVPEHIDALVAACLAKDPASRPQSFVEVRERLLWQKGGISPKPEEKTIDGFDDLMDKGTSLDSLGKPEEALACFGEAERALALSKDSVQKTAAKVMLAYNMAVAYEHLGDYKASLSQWDRAIELVEQIPKGYRYVSSNIPFERSPALLGKALTLAEMGKLEEAMEICREVLSSQPDNQVAISRMGYLLLRAEQYQEAIGWCTRAVQMDERDMHSLSNLGAALAGVGRIEEARATLQQALNLAPTHPPTLYSMGTLLLERGSPDQAIDYLKKAVAINPKYSQAWNNLGMALSQTGQPGYGECFEKALRADPNNRQALTNLVGFIQQERKCSPEEALAIALVSAGLYKSTLHVAQSLFEQGAFAEALTLFDRILINDKHSSEAKLGKASCLHRLGRPREAIRLLEALAHEEPHFFLAWHNLGAMWAEIGDVKKAITYYERALGIDHQHAETWYGLALLKYRSDSPNRAREALDCLDQAIRLRPDFAGAHGTRGRILDDLNRNAEALESYNRALTLSPGMPGEMFGRGLVLFKLERFSEAAAAFEELYQLDPDCTQAVANQVIALAITGQWEKAHSVLGQALQAHPKDQNLLMAAAQLRNNRR